MNNSAKLILWLHSNSSRENTYLFRMVADLNLYGRAYYYVRYRKSGVSHRFELVRLLESLDIPYSYGHDYSLAPRGGKQGDYIFI